VKASAAIGRKIDGMHRLLLALVLAPSASAASAGAPLSIDGAWVLSAEATEAAFLVVLTYKFKGKQGQVTLPRDPRGRGFHLVSSEAHTAVYEDDGTQQRFTVSVERGGR